MQKQSVNKMATPLLSKLHRVYYMRSPICSSLVMCHVTMKKSLGCIQCAPNTLNTWTLISTNCSDVP